MAASGAIAIRYAGASCLIIRQNDTVFSCRWVPDLAAIASAGRSLSLVDCLLGRHGAEAIAENGGDDRPPSAEDRNEAPTDF